MSDNTEKFEIKFYFLPIMILCFSLVFLLRVLCYVLCNQNDRKTPPRISALQNAIISQNKNIINSFNWNLFFQVKFQSFEIDDDYDDCDDFDDCGDCADCDC